MQVFIEREKQEKQLTFSGSAEQLCAELDINPQTVLILKNNTLVTEDEQLADDDAVKLLTVVSGG